MEEEEEKGNKGKEEVEGRVGQSGGGGNLSFPSDKI
jgi:hypothetical protein